MVRASMDESNSYSSLFEQTMVMLGESLPDNLTPEMNSPSAQFLSASVILHPSCRVKAFLALPLEPPLLELALATPLVPSKFWQKARMETFLKVLTELDCELELDCDELLPPGPLLWLELELEEEDLDELDDSSTFFNMTPDKT